MMRTSRLAVRVRVSVAVEGNERERGWNAKIMQHGNSPSETKGQWRLVQHAICPAKRWPLDRSWPRQATRLLTDLHMFCAILAQQKQTLHVYSSIECMILRPWKTVLLGKLTVAKLIQKRPVFYGKSHVNTTRWGSNGSDCTESCLLGCHA
jgi:hypothetical protein